MRCYWSCIRKSSSPFDAVSYVKEAWQSMSPSSIKDAFIKAEIMTLEAD